MINFSFSDSNFSRNNELFKRNLRKKNEEFSAKYGTATADRFIFYNIPKLTSNLHGIDASQIDLLRRNWLFAYLDHPKEVFYDHHN